MAFALADAATQVETARLLTWNAARLADQGNKVRYAAAMAKLTAQRMAESVTSLAIEIHGGTGYTTDCLAEKLWRDAKAGTIYEGHREHAAHDDCARAAPLTPAIDNLWSNPRGFHRRLLYPTPSPRVECFKAD